METNRPLVLTLDVGTQSLRVSLVDVKGNFVAIIKKPYEPCYFSLQNGYAEQFADFYYERIIECLKELTANHKDDLKDIVGASITTFRDSSVQLDINNKPIRPCILWLDQRVAKCKTPLPLIPNLIFNFIGMGDTILLNRRRTVANWLIENEPSTWSKTCKYVNISTYLIYKITGKLIDSSSSLTGHYPINFKKGCWYGDKHIRRCFYAIPNRMLSELKQPGEILGIITDEFADLVGLPRGLKLIAAGSDKACETIGLGALSSEIGAISYGTASTIEVSNKKYHAPERFMPCYQAATPGYYNMEVQVYRGYWMLKWFSKEFANELIEDAKIKEMAVEEILNESLSRIPPGCDGLVLQPYWGPGLSRPLSKGAILGFSDIHTRNHLYRAIIEGIAYALLEGLQSIEKSQREKIKELMISGGGSQSEIICQITSDIFGLPVSRVQTYETTILGLAITTFTALKYYPNIQEAMKVMSRKSVTFYPNTEANRKYQYLFKNVYLKMYPKLKNTYKYLNAFNKKYSA